VLIALCSLAAFLFVLMVEKESITRARTLAFLVLACSQIFHAFNCRSDRRSIFRIGLFTNPQLLLAAVSSFLLLVVVVYAPVLRKIFKAAPLTPVEWALAVVLSSFTLWAMEIVKLIRRKTLW
jgi:Ca2+-transporting ATPase